MLYLFHNYVNLTMRSETEIASMENQNDNYFFLCACLINYRFENDDSNIS